MQNVDALNAVGKLAKRIGAWVGETIQKVNPDVWRELAFVSMSSYSFLLPKREQIVDRGLDGFVPVVLVHGLGGNRGTWLPLKLFLRMNGHRRVYAFGYEDGTIEDHAKDLKLFVEKVLQATGESKADIVAHSLGGIIARYAIQRLGLADSVRTLITLAAPHQGTYAALYANTSLTKPLRPESDLIRDLNNDDLKRYPVEFVAIYSDRDVYIIPAESATYPSIKNVFVPNISHSQHLVSPRVFRVVASCLHQDGLLKAAS